MGLVAGPQGYVGGKPQAQEGTPFAAETGAFLSPIDVPCVRPPWALISAVDLRTGRKLWERPFGQARDNGPFGIPSMLPITMGVPAIGGSVVTAGGLVFIGASMERSFHAIDLRSGRILWKDRLPAAANATPMTYVSPRSGRQFVVVAAGGHPALRAPFGDYLIAWRLPSATERGAR
jgi:quinoprotein glucose dehydrogenase